MRREDERLHGRTRQTASPQTSGETQATVAIDEAQAMNLRSMLRVEQQRLGHGEVMLVTDHQLDGLVEGDAMQLTVHSIRVRDFLEKNGIEDIRHGGRLTNPERRPQNGAEGPRRIKLRRVGTPNQRGDDGAGAADGGVAFVRHKISLTKGGRAAWKS